MDIERQLQAEIRNAFQAIWGLIFTIEAIDLQPTKKEFEGDYTLLTFPFVHSCKLAPPIIAKKIGDWLESETDMLKDYHIVNGFLNLTLLDTIWLNTFKLHRTPPYELNNPSNGQSVVIEFSSPNTNKPLHLGHLRNNFLGYAVSKILQAVGYQVYQVSLINDRGIHICKSMTAYKRWAEGETPESTCLKGDHFVGNYYVLFEKFYKAEINALVQQGVEPHQAAQKAPLMTEAIEMLQRWERGDPDVLTLWKKMNEWVYEGFEKTYQQIGIVFDKIYYESKTYLLGKKVLQEGLTKGIFYQEADGSIWIDLQSEGLDKKLLLRADGTAVYMTQDLGTADLRYIDFKPNKLIYVVGNEQDYHFAVLFKIIKHLKRSYANQVYHLSYGMVDLPTGKMKSREGTVVDADHIISQMMEIAELHTKNLGKCPNYSAEASKKLYHILGMGALKYYLLRVDAKKRLLFDPQASIDFHGDTGPFIQYTHARIFTLLEKAKQTGILFQNNSIDTNVPLSPIEKSLIIQLLALPKKLQEAAASYSPHIIAQQAIEVAKAYNRLYAELPILHEIELGKRVNRLHLSSVTAYSIAWMMNLLGIEVPTKM